MINPANLHDQVKPKVRQSIERRWGQKQERIKRSELRELNWLVGRMENRLVLSQVQKTRLAVLMAKHNQEEVPA